VIPKLQSSGSVASLFVRAHEVGDQIAVACPFGSRPNVARNSFAGSPVLVRELGDSVESSFLQAFNHTVLEQRERAIHSHKVNDPAN